MHQTVQHGSYKFLASRRGPKWSETHDTTTRNIRIVFVLTADRDVTKPRDIYNIRLTEQVVRPLSTGRHLGLLKLLVSYCLVLFYISLFGLPN